MITPQAEPSLLHRSERAEVSGLERVLAKSREAPVTKVLGRAAKLGDQEPLYAAAAVLVLLGFGLGHRRLVLAGLRIGTAVALSDALKSATKKLVARTRPRSLADDHAYKSELGGSDDKAHQSFPSGHVAATLAAARALYRVYPSTGALGMTVVVGLGLTRVAQGEHWPTDVAAGAFIGGASELASGALIDRLQRALVAH